MTDPIADIIGDYRAFTAPQRDRLAARGIDIAPYELSHLAVRVPEWDQYVHLRPVRGLHPREVPPPLAARGGRAEGRDVRRRPPRRRLGPAAAGHGDRPEPPAPVNEPPAVGGLLPD